MRILPSWEGVLIAAVLSCATAGAATPRIVVHDVVTTGLAPHLIKPLNEFILTEFQAAGRYEVLGGSDITSMLEAEVQRQLMGCDDQECLAEIAGAMNAQFIADSNVGRLGQGYLVNIKIIDAKSISVVSRASVRCELDEEQLMAAARTAVRVVNASSSVADELPSITPLPIVLLGVSAAALGTGIGFGIKAEGHHRNFMDPTYADYQGAARDGEMSQIVANVAFGTALLSAGAAVLAWWFGGERVEILPEGSEASATTSLPWSLLGGRW